MSALHPEITIMAKNNAKQQQDGQPSRAFTVWTEPEALEPKTPRLVVLRVMVSGRHLKCAWGDDREIVLEVANSANFKPGMEIVGAYHKTGEARQLWRYMGKLPRRFGIW